MQSKPEQNNIYNRWHSSRYHVAVHWITFGVVGGCLTLFLFSQIQKTYSLPYIDLTVATPLVNHAAASSKPVISQSDISYLGAIRMPSGVDTAFAAKGALTGRMVNGHLDFFVYGNPTQGDQVYEIQDPGSGYNTDYTQAPRASLVKDWGDIYGGKRITWRGPNNTPLDIASTGSLNAESLYWNDATQLLYWTYNDGYNVGGANDWQLGASSLDSTTGTATAYGPWRTVSTNGDGGQSYGPWRCLYLFSNPTNNNIMCGSTIQSGNAGAPWGPDAYGGAAWPTQTTPAGLGAPDLAMTSRYLEYYFMSDLFAPNHINNDGSITGVLRDFRRTNEQAIFEPTCPSCTQTRVNPALNNGVSSWSEWDHTGAAIWLNLPNKDGVIYAATLAGAVSQDPNDCVNAAHEWYSNVGVDPPIGADAFGCAPPVGITGPVTTQAFPAFIIYNPDDLNAVAAGTKTDYTVDPTSVIDMRRTYGMLTAGQGIDYAAFGGFYFDPTRNDLFALAPESDYDPNNPYVVGSLIQVFHINDSLTPQGPNASISASPTTIVSAGSSTITWATTGATSVSINPSIGTVSAAGTAVVHPTVTTTYTLTATNASGTTTAQTVVLIGSAPVTPTPPSTPSDTTPPTTSISSPTNNSTVSGNVSVTVSAADNVSVAGVQLKVDGTNVGSEDTTSPYTISWDSTQVTNGSHTLTAVARDSSNNTTTSAAITVTVSNTTTSTPVVNTPSTPSIPSTPSTPSPTAPTNNTPTSPTVPTTPSSPTVKYLLTDGTLIKDVGSAAVYVVANGVKRPFASVAALNGLGYNLSQVQVADTSSVPTGDPILTANQRHPRGAVVLINGTVYFLGADVKYPFPSAAVFASWGHTFAEVLPGNSFDSQMPNGAVVQAKE